MRISRSYALALAAAVCVVCAAPATASAQFQLSRAQMAPAERSEAQRAHADALNADMNALFSAQREFFRSHGRFAASTSELAELELRPESRIVLMVGTGWYVALGGDEEIGTMQQIVHRGERVPEAAREAARTDPRGAVLNPSTDLSALH